jgi:hypothetical protein
MIESLLKLLCDDAQSAHWRLGVLRQRSACQGRVPVRMMLVVLLNIMARSSGARRAWKILMARGGVNSLIKIPTKYAKQVYQYNK